MFHPGLAVPPPIAPRRNMRRRLPKPKRATRGPSASPWQLAYTNHDRRGRAGQTPMRSYDRAHHPRKRFGVASIASPNQRHRPPRGKRMPRLTNTLPTPQRLGNSELALAAQGGATQLRCAQSLRIASFQPATKWVAHRSAWLILQIIFRQTQNMSSWPRKYDRRRRTFC